MSDLSRLDAADECDLPDPEIWDAPYRLTRDDLAAYGGGEPRRLWRSPDSLEDDR